jgi:hypothetical protein
VRELCGGAGVGEGGGGREGVKLVDVGLEEKRAKLLGAAVAGTSTCACGSGVLEFVKEHPTASSIGIIVGAGALLGPDLLAGTAVAGKEPVVCVYVRGSAEGVTEGSG